jgi:hypothetical protein
VEFEINKIADSLSNNVLITPTFDTDAGGTSLNLIRDYYFFARVQNGGGVWTDWVSAYLPAPEVLPTGISLGEVKSSSLELSWTNPTGGPYDYYLVADTSLNFDSQERVSVLTTSNYTSGVIPGLKANTTYYLKIVKALGDLVSATPDTQAVTTVGQPLNVIVTLDGVNKSSATIRWTENLGNMIPGDHSYFVRVSSVNSNFSDPTKYFQKKLDYPPSEGTYQATFTELLPGNTPYYVQIIGVSRAGVQSVGPDTYSPGTPVFYTLPDQPQNVKFTSLGNSLTPENHLAVQWQHGSNNSTVTQYEVELTTTSGVWPATNHINFISRLTDPGATSTTTFVSIANQEYFVRVRAIAMETGANPSSWNESAPSTFTAVLGPVGLAVVNETTDTLTLQWNGEFFIDGKSFQNSPNTQYGVRWSTDPDFGSFLYDELILESPQVVMGRIFSAPLFPNTTYYIKITSIKTPNSTWPTVEEGAQGVTLALPPGDVDFKTYTSSASLAWDDSSGTYFRFKLKDNDGNIKDSNQKINISPEWIIGLSSNTTYYLQVKSLNHKDKENGSNSWEDYSPQATDAAAAELGATGFTLYTDSGR